MLYVESTTEGKPAGAVYIAASYTQYRDLKGPITFTGNTVVGAVDVYSIITVAYEEYVPGNSSDSQCITKHSILNVYKICVLYCQLLCRRHPRQPSSVLTISRCSRRIAMDPTMAH